MHMGNGCENTEFSSIITIAAVIAIIIAIAITGYVVVFTEKQHSSLYLIPDSYQNLARNDTIFFAYGVINSEGEVTDYDIGIYLNNTLVVTEQFRLDTNERYEKNEEVRLTKNVSYPAKVEVLLTNKNTMNTEEVHFWIETNT